MRSKKIIISLAILFLSVVSLYCQENISQIPKEKKDSLALKDSLSYELRFLEESDAVSLYLVDSIRVATSEIEEEDSLSETIKQDTIPKKPLRGFINNHEWVDLGLSVMWATCNVGAEEPPNYGDYFAWGETSPKSIYNKDSSLTYGKLLLDIEGDYDYDGATNAWGEPWRMPTKEEFQELIQKCSWTWTIQDDVSGYKVMGANGNSIFLPVTGWRDEKRIIDLKYQGNYWSASPDEGNSYYAYFLNLTRGSFVISKYLRYNGRVLRAVIEM